MPLEYALTVTDTETGSVAGRESGLVYSGESGGMNLSGTGVAGDDTLIARDDESAADGSYLEVKLPDLLVTSYQTSAADAGYGYDAPGRLLVTTDAAGGSWTGHGTILTGNPADAARPIGPFMGVFVGSSGGSSTADTQVNPPSWGLDRIDQHVGGSDLSDWQSHYGTGGAAAASSGGGGAGKVSFQDMSMTVSVPKAAEHDTVELVKFEFSFDKIEMEPGGDPGADDLLFADADAAALGVVVGDRFAELAPVKVGRASACVGFMQTRLERDGLCVVGNRAVKVALVVPGTGPIEITAASLWVDRNQRIGVRDDTIVFAQFGHCITAIAVRDFQRPAGQRSRLDTRGTARNSLLMRDAVCAAETRRQLHRFGDFTTQMDEMSAQHVIVWIEHQ